jgi:DNA-binding NtrC family response regulator
MVRVHRRYSKGTNSICYEGALMSNAATIPVFDGVIGAGDRMQEVIKSLARAADSPVTVTLRGEGGTGKEHLARALHFAGPRRDRPFITVKCENVAPDILRRELFGDRAEASNGAAANVRGAFMAAGGGTIFLDEVGALETDIQINLLRVLQENRVLPAGAAAPVPVDVRLICASNKDLEQEMKAGRLREDLYYRLSVYGIHLPPLRDRREDIPALAGHFIQRFDKLYKRSVNGISPAALQKLMHHAWPGNVQELESIIERGVLSASGDTLLPEHLLAPLAPAGAEGLPLAEAPDFTAAVSKSREIVPLREIEKAALRQALKITNYNMSLTASSLGIGRTTLYRKLQKYQIPVQR